MNTAILHADPNAQKGLIGELAGIYGQFHWGLILGLFAVGLLATGALKAVQLSSIIVALPLIPVLLLMVVSLMKWLREDYGHLLQSQTVVLPADQIRRPL